MWLRVCVGGVVAYLSYHMFFKRRRYPPGPVPLPIFGNIFQMETKYWKTLERWGDTYGPVYTVWIGEIPVVVLAKYKIIKECLTGKGLADIFSGRPRRFVDDFFFGKPNALGIILNEGDVWKDQRRFTLHVLRNFGFGRNLMETRIMDRVDELEEDIDSELKIKPDGNLHIKPLIERCTGNIINSLVLGFTFKKDDPTFQKLKNILTENMEQRDRVEFLLLDDFPWLRYIPLFGHFGFDALSKQKEGFDNFFTEQLEEHKKHLKEGGEVEDFASAYLAEIKERGGDYNETQLGSILADLWIAGLETTVTTLDWAILFLIHHPEIQDKVRQELEKHVPESVTLSMTHRNQTPYFNATIQEIQRLANIVPYNLEHTVYGEDAEIGGFPLKKGTFVQPLIGAVLNDGDIFPEPVKFDPERFLDSSGGLKKVDEFIPFSMGKRSCMGESLAKTELYLILGTLVRKYRFSVCPGQEPPSREPVVGTTLTPSPYSVHVEKLF